MKRTPDQQPISTLVRRYKRGKIDLNPTFQRGPVWSKGQKQSLVDTILRDMDIPKIYLREVSRDGFEHEVVDGQQRLRAVIDFCNGKYKTEPTEIDEKQIPAVSYEDLDELSDELRDQFDTYAFSVVILRDATDEEVEDMFLRLQNGTPLKAQERRNAITGNMRDFVNKVSEHGFFLKCGFKDSRSAFAQVAAQMVRLELGFKREGKCCNIKKSDLDKMYMEGRDFDVNSPEARDIQKTLECLLKAFPRKVPELKPHNVISMFLLLRHMRKNFAISGRESKIGEWFVEFETARLEEAEKPTDERENELIEYQEKTGHSTDAVESLEYRQKVLQARVFGAIPDLKPLDSQRAFTDGQRLAIWRRDKGACQIAEKCGGEQLEWDGPWHADHITPWSQGGETTVKNGQVACSACNLAKGNSAS